jgi:hypothetical protein
MLAPFRFSFRLPAWEKNITPQHKKTGRPSAVPADAALKQKSRIYTVFALIFFS